jgi:D-glucosaminate-6-phosphate ammonia-lyase
VIGDPAEAPVTKPSVLEELGLTPVINAKGAASQLGGNLLSAAAQGAMIEAGQRFVPLQELQARASEAICRTTGAEAGCVASGAAACLFLAAAACMAGDDLAAMDRLPDTTGLRNEIVMHRAHRNPYDHALRATGARLVEVGYLGGPSSPGTRWWEFESAITDRACACFFVASGLPTEVLPLATVAEIAHRHGVPVVVDAAGVMPPADNLTRFIREGADLVAFSGDMYVHPSMWSGPFGASAPIFSVDPPRQGMGRMLKVGREEIAGLIAALEEFSGRDHAAEDARHLAVATEIAHRLGEVQGILVSLGDNPRPNVIVDFTGNGGASRAAEVAWGLRQGSPRVFCVDAWIHQGIIMLQASTVRDDEVDVLIDRVTVECQSKGGRRE